MLRLVTVVVVLCLTGVGAAQPVRLAALAQGAQPTPGALPSSAREPVDSSFIAGVTDVASLQKSVDARLSRAQQLLTDLITVKGQRTVANTLEPYDELVNEIQSAGSLASLMSTVHPDETMRKAGDGLERKADAMDALRKAWGAGYRERTWVRRDPDLVSLRDDPEFDQLYPP